MNPLLSQYLHDSATGPQWHKINTQKRAGVLAPLFGVYSKKSVGIGDLTDLKLLIDWAKAGGNSILQLLPMNECGPVSCPYDSVSSFALEPAYICLDEIAPPGNLAIISEIEKLKKTFPCGGMHLDYAVKSEKLRLTRDIYDALNTDSWEFSQFQERNNYWLTDFALYKALKEFFKCLPWYEWEEKFRRRDPDALEDFKRQHQGEIFFTMWLQWQLYKQFRSTKAYAGEKEVFLKGDLPILVSRDSADVWAHPEFFKLEFAAGAPPDMYCAKGQRWGMPTYNWENISADGYRYLKERLKYAQNFYDLVRIDHAVGVFRIWSIPYNDPPENQGLRGFFDPADQGIWEQHGRNILTLILQNTDMLLCAEDLGIIPPACPKTLAELGIPGNDVQRWVKDWSTRHNFLPPDEFRQLSVATLSTHDTTNYPAWWENEAGTVDEALFVRKCHERAIDFARVRHLLFDPRLSRHGRLRWRQTVKSADILIKALGKKREEIMDFIDMYENTYLEKEKLWKLLRLRGHMQELYDVKNARAALKMSLGSAAIFCINTIVDLLYLGDILKGDPYRWRINTPGTVSPRNWSLVMPLALEDLLKHKVTKEIRKLNKAARRI